MGYRAEPFPPILLRLALFKRLIFALKGRDNPAQGNALGTRRELKNTSAPQRLDRFWIVETGRRWVSILEPRALPWAELFGPFRATPSEPRRNKTARIRGGNPDDETIAVHGIILVFNK